ncbi:DUF1217 domain-containing protein [Ciceribacter ferrooxidans]|uniref:DUF1217 domain-containing protein n=1 Tax=Ciceribacter ferrooxidans TaxID=2509717 RepID=A0A4Q2S8T9_9HYPH|nr:DUF1217 domain-containing protein [Ciceribacter ferrooxidans]
MNALATCCRAKSPGQGSAGMVAAPVFSSGSCAVVSTYLSYDLVVRNLKSSLDRVASDAQTERLAAYYKENIDKVTTVDEFLDDYRLYSYAMKAHGLEDMTYAKAFMKKVLESDLNDSESYANKLTDERYRNFALAFQFVGQVKDVQTDAQETAIIDGYKRAQVDLAGDVETETNYYEAAIDTVTSADQLVKSKRLFNYVLEAYGIDRGYYTNDHFVKILTSDTSDPNSYVNQLVTDNAANSAAFLKMAQAFNFNADGSLSAATAQTADQKEATVYLYVDGAQNYVSEYTLAREKKYYSAKMATITSVGELTSDTRLFDYVKTAFQLDAGMTSSVFKSIVTSDLSDPNNYAVTNGGAAWVAIAQKFNFDTAGNVKAGYAAQQGTQIIETNSAYAEFYDDKDVERMDSMIDYYKTKLSDLTDVDVLLGNAALRPILLKPFGIEAGEYTDAELRKALTSDVTDPASFVNRSRDERLVKLAEAFNFDGKGDAAVPLLAQNQLAITRTAKDYIVNKIRFLEGDDKTKAKTAAEAETKYYQEKIQSIRTVDDLLADRRVVDVVLGAYGFDPANVSDEFLKQIFSSDLDDEKSFVNQQTDEDWAELLASFNFDGDGNLTRETVGTVQQRGSALETANMYLRQSLEESEGESNQGVRLALYFERMAPTLTDAYGLIADSALLEVFRVTYGFPSEFSSMDVDVQAKIVKKNLDLSEMQDPAKVKRLLQRFTAMYDMENSTTDPVLGVFGDGSAGISGDLLMSLATLRSG